MNTRFERKYDMGRIKAGSIVYLNREPVGEIIEFPDNGGFMVRKYNSGLMMNLELFSWIYKGEMKIKRKRRKNFMRENLRNARKAAGFTQQQMAEKLGITLRAYQQIEAGDYQGKIEHWDKLEDLFGIHQRKLRELFATADKEINGNAE